MSNYNGYTNYETWAVSLWLNQPEDIYNYWNERAKKLDVYNLSEEIKEDVINRNPLKDSASVYLDILATGLKRVNWMELAESFK
jgi:hypothetical protein